MNTPSDKPKTWGDIYKPLELPAFAKALPGEDERLERERLEMRDKPLPGETEDDYPCGINTPKWEGEWLSPCSVEVKRCEAFLEEHTACRGGLDRLDFAWRGGFARIVTVHCHCGAFQDITHKGHL